MSSQDSKLFGIWSQAARVRGKPRGLGREVPPVRSFAGKDDLPMYCFFVKSPDSDQSESRTLLMEGPLLRHLDYIKPNGRIVPEDAIGRPSRINLFEDCPLGKQLFVTKWFDLILLVTLSAGGKVTPHAHAGLPKLHRRS